ncbi:MAG: coproporphyrinogen-III oxidase family protein [Sedimenticola sp.]
MDNYEFNLAELKLQVNLDTIISKQPIVVQKNKYVGRAVEVLKLLNIEERLLEIRSFNDGVIGKPYLHATGGDENHRFEYSEIAESINRKFPNKIGALYVHFPFCTKKCRFCHYYKDSSASPQEWEAFPENIVGELKLLSSLFQFKQIHAESIHFGGGSPSLLSPDAWWRFIEGTRQYVNFDEALEIALEPDPEDVDRTRVNAWLESGINRVSLGVQSFDTGVLTYLRRGHTGVEAMEGINLLMESGIPNVNVDMMYGMPNRSLQSWIDDLEVLKRYRPHSATCYATRPDSRNILEKAHDFPSDMERIIAHQVSIEYMMGAGYFQYSPNQFITGYQGACLAKNNRNRCKDVLGIGPRAHSIFQGWFYENFVGHDQYRKNISSGMLCPIKGNHITPEEEKRRFLQFGLKLSGLNKSDDNNGVKIEDYNSRFDSCISTDFQSTLDVLADIDLIEHKHNDSLTLTHTGVLLSYDVGKYIDKSEINA